ncbi:MAG: trypsin-like peptidase domain-containing protein [Nitrospira sp.]
MPNPNPTPPEHPPLRGSAPPNLYGFEDETGNPIVGGAAIIPLLELIEGREYRRIGTGFFITSSGVFATAKHVLLSALNSGRPIFTWQLILPNQWHIRPVLQIDYHDTADVAIGLSCPSVHEETRRSLVDVRVRLTTRQHIAGDVIATFAYPNTVIQATEAGQILSFNPEFYEGRVVEYLSNGRDRVMLPGPCYRTDMVIHHGASGGPVAGPSGKVFGINSTGFDGTDDFYISRIDEIFSLEIATDESDRISIQQLVNVGAVTVDP